MEARLMRSEKEKLFAGVCGGLGIYLGVDPVLVRLAFVLLTFTGGVGVLLYFVLMIIMPSESDVDRSQGNVVEKSLDEMGNPIHAGGNHARQHPRGPVIAAGLLIVLGLYLLSGRFGIPFLGSPVVWALVLIGVGIYLIVQRRQ
jgi:phage shock protein C